jgi:hypothetical protein
MLAPASRFSKRALTGTRVPLNNQVPLALPGCRSTTGHWPLLEVVASLEIELELL